MKDNTMIDLREMVTDADIMLVLNRIKPRECADPDYWYATVDLIEDGWSPTGTGRLTMSELNAWETRLKTGQGNDAQNKTGRHLPSDSYVADGSPRENHRVTRAVYPSHPR